MKVIPNSLLDSKKIPLSGERGKGRKNGENEVFGSSAGRITS
jgi:hypothetical protein